MIDNFTIVKRSRTNTWIRRYIKICLYYFGTKMASLEYKKYLRLYWETPRLCHSWLHGNKHPCWQGSDLLHHSLVGHSTSAAPGGTHSNNTAIVTVSVWSSSCSLWQHNVINRTRGLLQNVSKCRCPKLNICGNLSLKIVPLLAFKITRIFTGNVPDISSNRGVRRS